MLGYYRPFTVDHNQVPNADQTNYPVVISGTYSWAASVANGGRAQTLFDLRPFSDAGLSSAYTYQLRSYNATTGAFNMVVLIPTLSHTVDTVIYVGIGDASLTTDGSSTAVWDSNFKGVWALGDGTTLSLADSTSNGNTLTNIGSATATGGVAGGMGAVSLNGTTQYLKRTAAAVTAKPVTIEGLFNPINTTANGVIISQDRLAATAQSGVHVIFKDTAAHVQCRENLGTPATSAAASVTAGAWNYAAGTITSLTSRDIHVNGLAKVSDATSAGSNITPDNLSIGARFTAGVAGGFMGGSIGEVRISNITRSDNWIKTTDANLRGIASFYSVGSEVAVSAPAGDSVGIATLTADAQELIAGGAVGISLATANAQELIEAVASGVAVATAAGQDLVLGVAVGSAVTDANAQELIEAAAVGVATLTADSAGLGAAATGESLLAASAIELLLGSVVGDGTAQAIADGGAAVGGTGPGRGGYLHEHRWRKKLEEAEEAARIAEQAEIDATFAEQEATEHASVATKAAAREARIVARAAAAEAKAAEAEVERIRAEKQLLDDEDDIRLVYTG